MTSDKRDEEWLAALEGKPSPAATESAASIEGGLIRAGLQAALAREVNRYVPGPALLDAIERQADGAGLLSPPSPEPDRVGRFEDLAQRLLAFLPRMRTPSPAGALSFAAGALGEALAPNLWAGAVRSEAQHSVTLRVESVAAAVADWNQLLSEAKIDHAILFDESGSVGFQLPLTTAALDVLASRRIIPPAGTCCTLVIESTTHAGKTR